MADYINRKELLKKLYDESRYFLHYGMPYFKVADIKSMPSVDVVEVVRNFLCDYISSTAGNTCVYCDVTSASAHYLNNRTSVV